MANCRACGEPDLLWVEIEGQEDDHGRPRRIPLESHTSVAPTQGESRYRIITYSGPNGLPLAAPVASEYGGEAWPNHNEKCVRLTSPGRV